MPQPLNVIQIVADDLGRTLGCYDRPVHTPNLDALVQSGLRFRHAVTNTTACSWHRAAS